jgi:hypothetical protein
MFVNLLKSKITYLLLFTYALFVFWWGFLYLKGQQEGKLNLSYGLAYALVAVAGGINGLLVAKKWGGFKSEVGRGLSFFSIGLLSLAFGQLVFSYYNFVSNVEVPFPSLADVGYTSIIVFYILGGLALAKAAGSKFRLKTLTGKLFVLFIPLVMLSLSYFVLLRDVDVEGLGQLAKLLSFGTPLAQAVYISIALATYQLSRKLLGGVMRKRIMFLIVALVAEYVAEFTFFYQANRGTYYNGGIDDLLFATAIIVMILGIHSFKLKEQPEITNPVQVGEPSNG